MPMPTNTERCTQCGRRVTLRAQIWRTLVENGPLTTAEVCAVLDSARPPSVRAALHALWHEHLVWRAPGAAWEANKVAGRRWFGQPRHLHVARRAAA